DLTGVNIAYSVNGGTLIQIPMTGGNPALGATSDWTGIIPVPSPSNARIDWGVVAIDELSSKTEIGTPYEDENLLGATLLVEADPNPACSGTDVVLTATPILPKTPVLINEYTGTTTNYAGPFYAINGNKHMKIHYLSDKLKPDWLRPVY